MALRAVFGSVYECDWSSIIRIRYDSLEFFQIFIIKIKLRLKRVRNENPLARCSVGFTSTFSYANSFWPFELWTLFYNWLCFVVNDFKMECLISFWKHFDIFPTKNWCYWWQKVKMVSFINGIHCQKVNNLLNKNPLNTVWNLASTIPSRGFWNKGEKAKGSES